MPYPATLVSFAAACMLAPTLAPAQADIDTPRAGWRDSAGTPSGFLQPVHYPASSVNVESANAAALIAGHLAAAAQGPATLIVNGVSMPLQLQPGGGFARPYTFGKGSNSVEVRAGEGKQKVRRQFYEAYAAKLPVRMRVVLSWDTDATDVDLHVVSPRGEHAWWGDRVMPSGGGIDVDVTTGYGPEIFAHPSPPEGLYHIYVNYYGSGEQRDIITTAQVTVITDENTPREKQQVFRVPLRKPGELTLVQSFTYP